MNGIICINKPQKFTSFDVIAKLRGILGEKKMGHAGTLDPMATGVLPIFCGTATKAIPLLEDQTKRYRATLRLGLTTDTEDIWGKVTKEMPVNVCKGDVLDSLKAFHGAILQTPPMYSALHVDGKRLYELARRGIETEREPRQIEIYKLELVGCDESENEYTVDVDCSKGTYIRTLCADIGKRLGCGAVMTALCRTRSCGFPISDCLTMEELQSIRDKGGDFPVMPVQNAFSHLPSVTVTAAQATRFSNGNPLSADRIKNASAGDTRVFAPDGSFLGIGTNDGSELKVKKLFIVREDTYSDKKK